MYNNLCSKLCVTIFISICVLFCFPLLSLADDWYIVDPALDDPSIRSSISSFSSSSPSSDSEPVIVVQPESQNFYGNPVTFRIVVSGSNFTLQWQSKARTSATWVDIPNATESFLNYSLPGVNSRNIRCKVIYEGGTIVSNTCICYYHAPNITLSESLSFLGSSLFSPLFNFVLPWGISFGAIIVGIFGIPLLIKAYKKFF